MPELWGAIAALPSALGFVGAAGPPRREPMTAATGRPFQVTNAAENMRRPPPAIPYEYRRRIGLTRTGDRATAPPAPIRMRRPRRHTHWRSIAEPTRSQTRSRADWARRPRRERVATRRIAPLSENVPARCRNS